MQPERLELKLIKYDGTKKPKNYPKEITKIVRGGRVDFAEGGGKTYEDWLDYRIKIIAKGDLPVPFEIWKKGEDYEIELNKGGKVEKPKQKPKPIPLKPKPIEIDYDWRLAPWQDYPEDDDIKKLVSQPSVEASNAEWWENEYYEYKKNGGDLPFEKFKQI